MPTEKQKVEFGGKQETTFVAKEGSANVSRNCDPATIKRNTTIFTTAFITLIASAVLLVVYVIVKYVLGFKFIDVILDPITLILMALVLVSAIMYFVSNSANIKCIPQLEIKK